MEGEVWVPALVNRQEVLSFVSYPVIGRHHSLRVGGVQKAKAVAEFVGEGLKKARSLRNQSHITIAQMLTKVKSAVIRIKGLVTSMFTFLSFVYLTFYIYYYLFAFFILLAMTCLIIEMKKIAQCSHHFVKF